MSNSRKEKRNVGSFGYDMEPSIFEKEEIFMSKIDKAVNERRAAAERREGLQGVGKKSFYDEYFDAELQKVERKSEKEKKKNKINLEF